MNSNIKIVVHGGAGLFSNQKDLPVYRAGVRKAVRVGYECLKNGCTAIDAVELAVMEMESNDIFNAGKGSVLTSEGTIEMDAMIMDGSNLAIGGVMGLQNFLHPISVSRKIMENDRHIFYQGIGADKIAKKYGFRPQSTETLTTERIRKRYNKLKEKMQGNITNQSQQDPEQRDKFGTVGAIAIDTLGNLASATSTGGFLGKEVGRVGDTPIPGAGTYADDLIAISSTGIGEYIIRTMLGLRVKQYYLEKKNLNHAATKSLEDMHRLVKGTSGLIALAKDGEHAIYTTTENMAYAYSKGNEIKDFMEESEFRINFE